MVGARDLGESAAAEWAQLVTTAVLGTDRRPLPLATPGWEPLATAATAAAADPGVELLDRAASVATARRAGVQPNPAPPRIEPAPADVRARCPAEATSLLGRLLRGEHDVLLPEWFALCELAGVQVPSHLIPALLLRGRRNPAFNVVVRRVIGARAAWLADAMPELGIKKLPGPVPDGAPPFLPPSPPPDSGAVVTAISSAFHDRAATWAAAAQLRTAVASLDAVWLPALILELQRAPFSSVTERTRVDVLGLAQARQHLVACLQPAGTRVRLAP